MKTIKVTLVLLLSSTFFMSHAQTMNEILSEDYKNYLGEEVGSFMEHKYIKNYKDSLFFTGSRPGILQGIYLDLTDDVYVKIIVNEFLFLERFDPNYKWDFSLFKREKISRILFLKENNDEVLLDIKKEDNSIPNRSYTKEELLKEINESYEKE